MSECKKYIPRDSIAKQKYDVAKRDDSNRLICQHVKHGACIGQEFSNKDCLKDGNHSCENPPKDSNYLKNCCKCEDKALRTAKAERPKATGGNVNLSKSEARELTQQLGGRTNKSTKIIYGGERAKIIGLDNAKNLLIQTNNALHRVDANNVKVNNKYVL
jgi:hypothetical protein